MPSALASDASASSRFGSPMTRPARSAQEIRATIGANIDFAHKRSGLGVVEVLRKLDIERTAFWRWRRGLTRPTDEHLEELASVYGLPLGWFFDVHDELDEEVAA